MFNFIVGVFCLVVYVMDMHNHHYALAIAMWVLAMANFYVATHIHR